jgi:N4-gp56 family major capsid protein
MADVPTTTGVLTNLVKTAFSKVVDMQLWTEPMFRRFASVEYTDLTNPGSSITKYIHADLANATSTLAETTDPDAVALANPSSVSITLNEYGNATISTLRLRQFSLSNIDVAQAELVSRNLRNSLDSLVLSVLRQGTNVVYSNAGNVDTTGPTNTVGATDVFSSKLVRYSVAKMRGRAALEFDDGYFVGFIHPDVSHDLRAETGVANWRDPHVYNGTGTDLIWKGEIGVYEGVKWIETPRTYSAADGASSATVHRTLIMGKEALAEAVSIEPGIVVSPQIDRFRRFMTVGWYGLLGWSRYREECLQRVESIASI